MPARKPIDAPLLDVNRIPRPLLAGCFILGCMLSCSLGMAARRPFMLATEMRAGNEKLARQYMQLKYQTQELERSVAIAQTSEGQEREARKRGYLKPGEARLTFLP